MIYSESEVSPWTNNIPHHLLLFQISLSPLKTVVQVEALCEMTT